MRLLGAPFRRKVLTVANHPIPTIQADDYPAFQLLIRSLPATFKEWNVLIDGDIELAGEFGGVVRLADVGPIGFAQYIEARRMGPTLSQLYRYAAHRAANPAS